MIGEWNPSQTASVNTPDSDFLLQLADLSAAPEHSDEITRQRAAQYIKTPENDWQEAFGKMSDEVLIQLAFFYVRAEVTLSGFEAGAKNPAIWVFRYLRNSGRKPAKDIVKALKAETDNRFIPYGNALL